VSRLRLETTPAPRVPPLTRRRLLALTGPAALAPVTAACGGATPAEPGAQPAARAVKITWWSNLGDQHPESKTRVQVIQEFNAASAPVEVVPEAFGADLTKIKTAIAGDTSPDTYFIAWREGAEVFLTGAVADVDAELKGDKEWGEQRKDFVPLMLETSSWKGKLASVPIYTNNTLTLWNTDLLQRSGLAEPKTGWTWDDFKDLTRKAGRPPELWGYELWADSSAPPGDASSTPRARRW
jgi:multiple sugar transport system substrate-binding protein